jgi:ubiquinone/menaquinone biosynthesis C-methylase UbiE
MSKQETIDLPLLHDVPKDQKYSGDPNEVRDTDQYQSEYVENFVERWDELIDWSARAEVEGEFFIDKLRKFGKYSILDVATGTGFHSVQLMKAQFDVTSTDGNSPMLVKAFENAKEHGLVMRTVQSDWRWLNRSLQDQRYDAVLCLGNSFTFLHEESDRRRVLAEFYSVLKHDGILIIDQRNYDEILDSGFKSKHNVYCGESVSAQPVYVDEGLARFEYAYEDGTKYYLNMFPLRCDYLCGLIRVAGFQKIDTFGDFEEDYQESEVDFFVHIAHKN